MRFKTKDCKLWLIHFSLAELFFALTVVTLKRRIIWALFGIVAGLLSGKIMRGGGFGLIINLLLGILGGVLGGWVFALFGLAASGLIGSLITSTVGAVLVLWIASLFSKSR